MIAKIYFELGRNPKMKQVFLSSLLKILEGHTMIIMQEKFKSITVAQIGYILKDIFQTLDIICTKRSVLKKIIHNNIALNQACNKDDLVTKFDCSFPLYKMR